VTADSRFERPFLHCCTAPIRLSLQRTGEEGLPGQRSSRPPMAMSHAHLDRWAIVTPGHGPAAGRPANRQLSPVRPIRFVKAGDRTVPPANWMSRHRALACSVGPWCVRDRRSHAQDRVSQSVSTWSSPCPSPKRTRFFSKEPLSNPFRTPCSGWSSRTVTKFSPTFRGRCA
jgi:hypothetical protein